MHIQIFYFLKESLEVMAKKISAESSLLKFFPYLTRFLIVDVVSDLKRKIIALLDQNSGGKSDEKRYTNSRQR